MNFLRIGIWVMHTIVIVVLLFLLYQFLPNINMEENSPIEWIQAAIIAMAMCIFYYGMIRQKEWAYKIASLGFMLLMFSFLIRELDVEEFILPEYMRYYLGKEGKDQTMVLLWGAYLVVWIITIKQKSKRIKRYLASSEGSIWYFVLVLLIISQMMDKNILHLHNGIHHFLEEFLELISYGYILSLAILRIPKQRS